LELLLSIPEGSPDTPAMVLAEIAGISCFDNPTKLAKWTELAPKVYQSGHKKNITGKIHKSGDKHLWPSFVLTAKDIYD